MVELSQQAAISVGRRPAGHREILHDSGSEDYSQRLAMPKREPYKSGVSFDPVKAAGENKSAKVGFSPSSNVGQVGL